MTLQQQLLKVAQEWLKFVCPEGLKEMQEYGYFANVSYDEFREAVEKLALPETHPHES